MSEGDCLPQLPISLSVELVSADEHSAVFFACAKDNQISRNALVRRDFDNLSYF